MKKLRQKIGFTMAELLIVVAIIAVLVAIAIPIFNTQLEKSREAYDIATMRSAASLATQYFYAGVSDQTSANAAGLLWQAGGNESNAFGVYDPSTGKFVAKRSTQFGKSYGKGTKKDSGKTYTYDDDDLIYASGEDYSNALCMVSIYPVGPNKHIDIYWKNKNTGKYIGGQSMNNVPKYSIRIDID